MIAQIDAARHRHNDAICAAVTALDELTQMINLDETGELEVGYFASIRAIDDAVDTAIDSIAAGLNGDDDTNTIINVGGDYIIANIDHSENVAVGKDIGQDVSG